MTNERRRILAPLTAVAIGAGAGQALVLAARSVADAALGSAPRVDAALTAALLLGFGLGALVRISPRKAALGLAFGGAAALGVVGVGTEAVVAAVGVVPLALRPIAVALALAALAAPAGALVPAVARQGILANRAYAADLLGAAVGISAASLLVARVGASAIAGAACGAAALAAVLLDGTTGVDVQAQPRPGNARAAPIFLLAVATTSLAVGVLEAALPRITAAATATDPASLAFVIAGALVGGALGARSALRIRLWARLALTGILTACAAKGAVIASPLLLSVGSHVEVAAWMRQASVGAALAALAALPAWGSGLVMRHALARASASSLLAASSVAAAAGALAGATVFDHVWPARLTIAAAMLPIAIAVCAAVDIRARVASVAGAALAAGVALTSMAPEPSTFDLSRAILLGSERATDGAERIVLDEMDGTGRTTIAIADDETVYRDGKADASLLEDIDTETLLGALPLVFRPDAKRALVIGLGSGTTARVLAEAGVERVDVLEISPVVVAAFAARLPPNVHVIEDDARAYLAHTHETWDIVTAEPTNLFVGSTPRLVTREAFEAMRARLEPDGVLVLWTHSYLTSPEALRMLARTAASAFAHLTTFAGRTADLLLVASSAPLVPAPEKAAARFSDGGACVAAALGHGDLGAVLRRATTIDFAAGPLHEDAVPRLVPLARRALWSGLRLATPAFSPPGSTRERLLELPAQPVHADAVVDDEAIAQMLDDKADGGLTPREALALVRHPAGRRALVGHAADLRIDLTAQEPAWAAPLANVALTSLLSDRAAPDALLAAHAAMDRPGCATADDWDLMLELTRVTARHSAGDARAVMRSLAGMASPIRERTRLFLAASACAPGDAACCATLAARLDAHGPAARAACGAALSADGAPIAQERGSPRTRP